MKAFAFATCIALLVPASGFSADEETLVRGTRVRLTSASSSGARLQGTIQSADETTLTIINDDHQMVKVSRAQLTKVEMAWGRKGRARKGLLIGGLAGLAAGVVVASSSEGFCFGPGDCAPLTTGEKVGVALFSAAGYGAIGAGIGALVKTDRWVEVPPDKIRVSVAPTSGRGIAVGVTFGF